jgi:tRNA (cmo5U34)-methyltransferase
MMADYRWNQLDNARGYDAAAEFIHPHYVEIQNVILDRLPFSTGEAALVVDLGGGSGRLAERILDRFSNARVWVIDQSEAFLTLARERLCRFGFRAWCHVARLQDDWHRVLPEAPAAIVSMSAIHHLDPGEKQRLYQQCAAALRPGGVLLNGDEVRPPGDADYLAACQRWVAHKKQMMAAGRIPGIIHAALRGWEARNVGQFGLPRVSGDDCHETADTQLDYFAKAGLNDRSAVWQHELWAVLSGSKPRHSARTLETDFRDVSPT